MSDYLFEKINLENPELVSVIDSLPLWSAPFGLWLLEKIPLFGIKKVLDIGFGTGFPLLEIAMMLGKESQVIGIDPWKLGHERTKKKILHYGISNVKLIEGGAENIPLEDGTIDLITSNNGLNNVQDVPKSVAELYRVASKGASVIFTMNLDTTMQDFYDCFIMAMRERGLRDKIDLVEKHIYTKRKPVIYIIQAFEKIGFKLQTVDRHEFKLRYASPRAFFEHFLIKSSFLPSWKELIPDRSLEEIFLLTEKHLSNHINNPAGLELTVPYALFEFKKP